MNYENVFLFLHQLHKTILYYFMFNNKYYNIIQTKFLFNLSFAIIMLMGVNACQSSDDETVSTNSETLVHSHAIPVEEALSSLNDFLKDNPTRANGFTS